MPRTFTLDEATALLPRLREIIAEMQEKKASLDALQGELRTQARTSSGNGHLQAKEVEEKQRAALSLVKQLNELSSGIGELGCELKGIDEGLVDFLSERDGQTVYLCWKLGEERIDFWHETDTGFAGRQPL